MYTKMKILAIETSCDETGIALVEGVARDPDAGHSALRASGSKRGMDIKFTVLKQALLSQAALHAQYGGVYPNLAKREHEKNLPVLYREFADDSCDAVAVTAGPGLEPALWQGIEYAKRVASEHGVSLLPVNHMEGHLVSSLAQKQHPDKLKDVGMFELKDVKLPVLALLISGGHTEFVLMREWFEYEVIGRTLDDAVGECFDKVARMLGLPYPGGPEISKITAEHRKATQPPENFAPSPLGSSQRSRPQNSSSTFAKLPRPMLNSGTCDMSFSGLKTAALYSLRDAGELSDKQKAAFAAEFEEAVGDVFVAKTRKALEDTGAQTFVIGGGVAANAYLRECLQKLLADEFPDIEMRLPDPSITGDNAVMIAQAALARRLSRFDDAAGAELRARGNLALGQKVL